MSIFVKYGSIYLTKASLMTVVLKLIDFMVQVIG